MEQRPLPLSKYAFLVIFFFLLGYVNSFGQESDFENQKEPSPFWKNVRFGGSLGLSFSNGNFTGALAPSAIYDFNEIFSAGAGLNGAYTSQSNFSATSLGGSVIGMVRPIRMIQLSAEFEELHINRRFNSDGGIIRDQYWVPALFLGAGYNTGNVVAGLRYDVLHGEKSFYGNALMPFVSVYF